MISSIPIKNVAQSVGRGGEAVEYTDFTSAEGQDPSHTTSVLDMTINNLRAMFMY